MNKNNTSIEKSFPSYTKRLLFLFVIFIIPICRAQAASPDDKLLDEYISSKGYSTIITFDASNIKQYWTSNSVLSKDDNIFIFPKKNNNIIESELYRIQLSHVVISQDCKIDIITENPEVILSVYDDNGNSLPSTTDKSEFLQYKIFSSSFHLEELSNYAFQLKFTTKSIDPLIIKKIVLSFSDNKESVYAGFRGFNDIEKIIEEKGKDIPNKDVKYYISKEHSILFVRILEENSKSHYVYHIIPADPSDVLPSRKQYGFNNHDFNNNKKGVFVPKGIEEKSPYVIVQYKLPTYKYSSLRIGQYIVKDDKTVSTLWGATLKSTDE